MYLPPVIPLIYNTVVKGKSKSRGVAAPALYHLKITPPRAPDAYRRAALPPHRHGAPRAGGAHGPDAHDARTPHGCRPRNAKRLHGGASPHVHDAWRRADDVRERFRVPLFSSLCRVNCVLAVHAKCHRNVTLAVTEP